MLGQAQSTPIQSVAATSAIVGGKSPAAAKSIVWPCPCSFGQLMALLLAIPSFSHDFKGPLRWSGCPSSPQSQAAMTKEELTNFVFPRVN